MDNKIIPLGKGAYKVLGFNEKKIILSSKKHGSFESLLASAEKSGTLEAVKIIPMKLVMKIHYHKKEEHFVVHYYQDGFNTWKILLSDVKSRASVVTAIGKLKGFKAEIVKESKIKALLMSLLGIIVTPAFTWVARNIAIDADNGIEYEATGTQRDLLVYLVEMIGTTGVTIIGVLVFTYLVSKAYKRFIKPALVIEYKK